VGGGWRGRGERWRREEGRRGRRSPAHTHTVPALTDEALGVGRDGRCDVIVEDLRQVQRVLRRRPVGEHHGHGREDVDVHTNAVAVPHAPREGPEVVLDLAERGPVVLHHHRLPGARVLKLDEAAVACEVCVWGGEEWGDRD
jgi:hypothetical protein